MGIAKRQSSAAVAAALVPLLLSACGAGGTDRPAPAPGGERKAVEAYVSALNSRDAKALLRLDGSTDKYALRDAEKVIAKKGGRGLRVRAIDIGHDFGPDTATAQLVAKDRNGASYRESLFIMRTKGSWFLTILPARKGDDGRTPAATVRPSDNG